MLRKHHIQDAWLLAGIIAGVLLGWSIAPSGSARLAQVATIAVMGYLGFMAATLLWAYAEPTMRSWLPEPRGSSPENTTADTTTTEDRSR